MFASFHSTSLPFIQILPVPGNAIEAPQQNFSWLRWKHESRSRIVFTFLRAFVCFVLLRFAAERTAIGSCVKRFSAMPAEARLRCLASFQSRLDLMRGFKRRLRSGRRRAPASR